MTDPQSIPVRGEQHERAVEAAGRAFAAQSTWGRDRNPEYVAMVTERVGPALDAYLASLREQGVVLVDLREVLDTIRVETYGEDDPLARHARVVADFLERRFGGNERSEDETR